ncbi:hypothetical protein QTN25_003594 [Entamoeba marina]
MQRSGNGDNLFDFHNVDRNQGRVGKAGKPGKMHGLDMFFGDKKEKEIKFDTSNFDETNGDDFKADIQLF